MFDNLDKRFFTFIINIIQSIRIVLVFLSFFVVIFWIFQIGQVAMAPWLVSFFESIKSFIHLFYNRIIVIDGKQLDFSFLVSAVLNLTIVWLLKFVIEHIREVEKNYFKIKRSVEKRAEDVFNMNLEREYLSEEYKNNKFLIMVKFNARCIKKIDIFGKTETIASERIEIERQVLNDFFELLEGNIICETKLVGHTVSLYLNNFSKADEVLTKLEKIITSIKDKYYTNKWEITSIICLDVYSKKEELPPKEGKLRTVSKIFTDDKMACLGTFKQRYSLQDHHVYTFESYGIYKIENNEEVFILKRLK